MTALLVPTGLLNHATVNSVQGLPGISINGGYVVCRVGPECSDFLCYETELGALCYIDDLQRLVEIEVWG
jgi:hypothetical protein